MRFVSLFFNINFILMKLRLISKFVYSAFYLENYRPLYQEFLSFFERLLLRLQGSKFYKPEDSAEDKRAELYSANEVNKYTSVEYMINRESNKHPLYEELGWEYEISVDEQLEQLKFILVILKNWILIKSNEIFLSSFTTFLLLELTVVYLLYNRRHKNHERSLKQVSHHFTSWTLDLLDFLENGEAGAGAVVF